MQSGDWVRVAVPSGARSSGSAARVTAIVRAGEVFIPFHWDERCANRLTNDEFDPISREPNYKQCAVRVEQGVALTTLLVSARCEGLFERATS